jgi:uncharacterized protein YidB (DUF937 family)
VGLLDMLEGMTNVSSGASPSSRSGMSPITMGLLALLAYKTMKGQGPLGGLVGRNTSTDSTGTAVLGAGGSGSVLHWLQSEMSGANTGGGVVSSGLTELLQRLEQNGLGDIGQSWVGNGPNQPVSPKALEKAAGTDTLDALAREAGLSREQLLQKLTAELPQAVDKLTPQGRVPTAQEAAVSI